MQPQANGPPGASPWRSGPLSVLLNLAWRYRCELCLGALVLALTTALLYLAPLPLVLALLERRSGRRRRGVALAGFAMLVVALAWAWRELRGLPCPGFHPCAACGALIARPSRACYCSPACRWYARLEGEARAFDPHVAERAAQRLRRLCRREQADLDPELADIPF